MWHNPLWSSLDNALGIFPWSRHIKKYWNSHVAEENVRGDPLYSKIFIEFLLSARTFCRSIYQWKFCGEPLFKLFIESATDGGVLLPTGIKKESGEILKRYSLLCACWSCFSTSHPLSIGHLSQVIRRIHCDATSNANAWRLYSPRHPQEHQGIQFGATRRALP